MIVALNSRTARAKKTTTDAAGAIGPASKQRTNLADLHKHRRSLSVLGLEFVVIDHFFEAKLEIMLDH